MIDVMWPELAFRTLELTPDPVVRDNGGQPHDVPATALGGRLRLGGPLAVPVSAAYVDGDRDLRAFVESESGVSDFHLVHIAITSVFESEQLRLERLRIELKLSAPGFDPVAWSMAPRQVTGASQLTTSFALGPQLKLFGMQADIGSVQHSRTLAGQKVFLQALNELRPDPEWRFQRTPGMEISGTHRLALVVRAPAGVKTQVAGSVHATVLRGKRYWWERTSLSDLLELSMEL